MGSETLLGSWSRIYILYGVGNASLILSDESSIPFYSTSNGYFPTNLVYPFTLRVTGMFPTNLVYPFTLRVTGIITMSTFETQNDYTLVQTHYLIFFVWLVSAKYLSPMPTQAFYIAACRVRTFYKVSFVLNINQHGYTLYFRCHINYSIFFRNKATVKIGFSKKTFY